jgi:hypothetical protein
VNPRNTWQQYGILAAMSIQAGLVYAIHQGLFPSWTAYLTFASTAITWVLQASHYEGELALARKPPSDSSDSSGK